jgi:hypothetical protein
MTKQTLPERLSIASNGVFCIEAKSDELFDDKKGTFLPYVLHAKKQTKLLAEADFQVTLSTVAGAELRYSRLFTTGRKDAVGPHDLSAASRAAREKHRNFHGPVLALGFFTITAGTPAKDQDDDRRNLIAMCQEIEKEQDLAPDSADMLILAGLEPDKPQAIYFRGGPENRNVLIACVEKLAKPDALSSQLKIFFGTHPNFTEMWIFDEKKDLTETIHTAADDLLDALLTANRPVADWRASYFAPVEVNQTLDPCQWLLVQELQADERNYIRQSAHKILGGENGLQTWEFVGPHNTKLCVHNANYGLSPINAKLAAIRLHKFGGDDLSGILEWELSAPIPDEPFKPEKKANLWQRYLVEPNKAIWPFAQLIDFLAEARFVKHHYEHETTDFAKEKITLKFSTQAKDPIFEKNNGVDILHLLPQSVADSGITLLKNGDDRARVCTSVILDGRMAPNQRLDSLLASLNAVDGYAPSGFYDEIFADVEFTASQYSRFWNKGTCFMAAGHSFTMLGFRHEADAIARGEASFVELKIHKEHMPHQYHRLYLLTLFQLQGLDDIGRRIADGMPWKNKADGLRELRKCWVDLRAARWFHSVSTQLQGDELYALMQSQMKIAEEVKLTDRKIKDLQEIYALEAEIKAGQAAKEAEGLAAITKAGQEVQKALEHRREKLIEWFGIPIAVLIALRELAYTGGDVYADSWTHPIEWVMKLICMHNSMWAMLVFALVISAPIFLALASGLHPKNWWKPINNNRWTSLFYGVFVLAFYFASVFVTEFSKPKKVDTHSGASQTKEITRAPTTPPIAQTNSAPPSPTPPTIPQSPPAPPLASTPSPPGHGLVQPQPPATPARQPR